MGDWNSEPEVLHDVAVNLVFELGKYPDVILDAFETKEACTVVKYLFKLAHKTSEALEKLRVIGEEERVAAMRVAMFASAKCVLGSGLTLLGLKPVEMM